MYLLTKTETYTEISTEHKQMQISNQQDHNEAHL